MTENDFQGLFGDDDYAEIAASMAEVEAEHAAEAPAVEVKKTGVWYVEDVQGANGHAISIYALNLGGKTVATARIDNDLEVSPERLATLGKVPAGVTGHAIVIYSADGGHALATGGIALRYPHKDGTHLDGQTVRAYVLPRAARFIGELYGV